MKSHLLILLVVFLSTTNCFADKTVDPKGAQKAVIAEINLQDKTDKNNGKE